MTSLLGACLLSAAGSLPLHLLPLLVTALVAEQRAPIALAGWIGSAYMLGQLLVALILPLLRLATLRRRHAVAAVALPVVCLGVAAHGEFTVLLLCWLLTGAGCGALLYLGTTVAAQHKERIFALSLRLAITLFLAGIVIGGLQLVEALSSYFGLMTGLAVVFFAIAFIGLALYRSSIPSLEQQQRTAIPSRHSRWSGLIIIFLLFTGQLGFWAYAVQSSGDRGIGTDEAIWALAICKVFAAFALLPMAYRDQSTRSRNQLLWPGVVLALGILLMSTANTPAVFLLGVLSWEVGLNVLSVRIQAKAVEASPDHAGMWLTGAILLGAAAGPMLHGAAIGAGIGALFAAFSVASALIPAIWERSVFAATPIGHSGNGTRPKGNR